MMASSMSSTWKVTATELEGIASERLTAPYKSGPCKSWIKVRNPRSAAYLRISNGIF